MIQRIPENHDITALNGLEAVNEFVNEDAFLVGEQRRHAGAFDFYGLIEKDDDDKREADGDEQVARPHANLFAQRVCRGYRAARGAPGSVRRNRKGG